MNKLLTVILPSYNEEEMIHKTAVTLHNILSEENIRHQLLFVDDGSKDNTWNCVVNEQCEYVSGIHFSKNFGKEAAMMAGLEYAKGDCVVVMDCDLQHPPIKVVEMYRLWQQGYEVIEGVKQDRGEESFIHAICAKAFYGMMSGATGVDMKRASDFKLLDRKAVLAILNIREHNSFFRALSSWVGFKTTTVEYCVEERTEGVSKWSTISLIKYAISNVTSFSSLPMQIVLWLGTVMFLISCVFGGITLVQKLLGTALEGFTTVILLVLFTSGILMMSLGIIGYYISKIYEEVKGRPRYIVSENI